MLPLETPNKFKLVLGRTDDSSKSWYDFSNRSLNLQIFKAGSFDITTLYGNSVKSFLVSDENRNVLWRTGNKANLDSYISAGAIDLSKIYLDGSLSYTFIIGNYNNCVQTTLTKDACDYGMFNGIINISKLYAAQ